MGQILVRYAELGLKSEKVRARFLGQLTDHINQQLTYGAIEHVITSTRGRIFIETEQTEEACDVLATVPGIHSFSVVESVPSEMGKLMDGLADYASNRLKEGMSFGMKVKRTGETPYTSRDVAVAGGDAVCRHLDDSRVSVDLKDPDIWFEVEVRGREAYLFTDRIRGIGGMPFDTQGKVLLLLDTKDLADELSVKRAALSRMMLRRRGCRVIPCMTEEGVVSWGQKLERVTGGEGKPFLVDDMENGTISEALKKTGSHAVVVPADEKEAVKLDPLHGDGTPASVIYPTVGLNSSEVESWLQRLSSRKL